MHAYAVLTPRNVLVEHVHAIDWNLELQPTWSVQLKIMIDYAHLGDGLKRCGTVELNPCEVMRESDLMSWRAAVEDLAENCPSLPSYARPPRGLRGKDPSTHTFLTALLNAALSRPNCRRVALEMIHAGLLVDTLADHLGDGSIKTVTSRGG